MEQSNKVQSFASSQAGVFMQQVYIWMFAGLLLTAVVAYLVVSVPALLSLVVSTAGMIVLVLSTLGLVIYLSARIDKLSAQAATNYFLLYAGINGAMLSPILLIYTGASIFSTFLITSGMFGALALYGTFTKRDLGPVGAFCMMGLFGIIIAGIVNIFVASSAMQFMIDIIGIIVFAGLTAYDHQKIRQMGETAPMDDAVAIRRGAIIGALNLYLDFINLFLILLRLFGNRD